MSKLALLTAVLLGACVADDPTAVARVGNDFGPTNVVDQVEIPDYGDAWIDGATVVITGIELPGSIGTKVNIDVNSLFEAEVNPQGRNLCALADGLQSSDTCSLLCQPGGFAARLNDQGNLNPGGCTQARCGMPGGTTVQVDVCMPAEH